jgi:hypothetical protein
MPVPSFNDILNQVESKVADIANKKVDAIAGFSETQLNFIAQHTVLISKLGAAGGLDTQADRDEAMKGLEDMVRNFFAALRDLALETAEEIWNSVVNILWGVIEGAIGGGVKLPRPRF